MSCSLAVFITRYCNLKLLLKRASMVLLIHGRRTWL